MAKVRQEGDFDDFYGNYASSQDSFLAIVSESYVDFLGSPDRWPFFCVAIRVFGLVGSPPGRNSFVL